MSDPVVNRYYRADEPAVATFAHESAKEGIDDASPSYAAFKHQAGQAAEEAKSTVAALAEEAKSRLSDIVDRQKAVGADHVAGVARAAQAAAGDLRQSSPQLARLVQTTAERVDGVARTLRQSDVADVVATLTDFGRRRPVAFFGGAVAVGFLLARFLKSNEPAKVVAGPSDRHAA